MPNNSNSTRLADYKVDPLTYALSFAPDGSFLPTTSTDASGESTG